MTFVLFGLLSSGLFLVRKDLTKNVNLGLRALRPLLSRPPPARKTSSGVSRPGTSSASSSHPLGGQGKPGGSQGAPGVVSGGASSPPARPRSSERGGSASGHVSGVGGLASSSPSPSGGGGVEVARSRQTSLSRVSESVDSPLILTARSTT